MSKSHSPDWILNDTWAVSRDTYNWILQSSRGDRWRAISYYQTPELLLKSLHQQLSRTMPANPVLLDHLEIAFKAGERLSDRLSDHIHASLGGLAKLTPEQSLTIGEKKVTFGRNGVQRSGTG